MHDPSLLNQLNDLELQLSDALRYVPGAQALLLFGSRATVRDDPFADLDLHLVTGDLDRARAIWPGCLAAIGPIELALPLTGAPGNTAYSVLFAGRSPYHKVDISLGAGPGLPAPLDSKAAVTIWQQAMPETSPEELSDIPIAQPHFGSMRHLIVDELLGTVRYVKARRRAHPLTAWRFLRSKPDRLLSLVYEARLGARPETPLSTWQIKTIETCLPADFATQFLTLLDWRDEAAMDRACLELTRQIIAQATALAEAHTEPLPSGWVDRQLAFLASELGS